MSYVLVCFVYALMHTDYEMCAKIIKKNCKSMKNNKKVRNN